MYGTLRINKQKLLIINKFNKMKQTKEVSEKKQCDIHDVVVPKGTLCECKKHSLKTNYGFEVCTKCGNEFDD